MERSIFSIRREFQRNARFKYINNDKCLKPLMVCNKCKKRSYCRCIQTFYDYYTKKKLEGKHHRVAMTHLAKKLIRIIFHLEKNKVYFDQSLLK